LLADRDADGVAVRHTQDHPGSCTVVTAAPAGAGAEDSWASRRGVSEEAAADVAGWDRAA